jgi:hypothetical protein
MTETEAHDIKAITVDKVYQKVLSMAALLPLG